MEEPKEIAEFRAANSGVLYDGAHPMHEARIEELRQMYEAHYSASSVPAVASPVPAKPGPHDATAFMVRHELELTDNAHPLHSHRVAELAELRTATMPVPVAYEGAVVPETPDGYHFRPERMPTMAMFQGEGYQQLEYDPIVDKQLRGWLHHYRATPDEVMQIEGYLYLQANAGFTDANLASLERAANYELEKKYGDRADEALNAARRVVKECGPELAAWLDWTHMGSHPVLIELAIRRAVKHGYFKDS